MNYCIESEKVKKQNYWNDLEGITRCVCEYTGVEKKHILQRRIDRLHTDAGALIIFVADEMQVFTLSYIAYFLDRGYRGVANMRGNFHKRKKMKKDIEIIKERFINNDYFPLNV